MEIDECLWVYLFGDPPDEGNLVETVRHMEASI